MISYILTINILVLCRFKHKFGVLVCVENLLLQNHYIISVRCELCPAESTRKANEKPEWRGKVVEGAGRVLTFFYFKGFKSVGSSTIRFSLVLGSRQETCIGLRSSCWHHWNCRSGSSTGCSLMATLPSRSTSCLRA